MSKEALTAAGLLLGYVLSVVGLTIALGAGWGVLWAGILLIAASLFFDARS